MTPVKRSRRLQAGLAGISVFSALGAAVGLGLTTHTHASQSSANQPGPRTTGHRSGEDDDGARTGRQVTRQGAVSPPSNTAPQATTSGS
jgi:hypothetical protein